MQVAPNKQLKRKAELEAEGNVYGDFNELNKYLHKLDERGQVLSVAAFAEECLGKLIKAFLRRTKTSEQLVEGFNAPLGTFSARIKICHSLGLITEKQYKDLEQIRNIRNCYAHTWRRVSFESPEVNSRIKALSFSRIQEVFPSTPKEKFLGSMSSLLIELQVAEVSLRERKLGAKEIGRELYAGFAGSVEDQLSLAAKRLTEIAMGIQSSNGEERRFYHELAAKFTARLGTISIKTSVQAESLAKLKMDLAKLIEDAASDAESNN